MLPLLSRRDHFLFFFGTSGICGVGCHGVLTFVYGIGTVLGTVIGARNTSWAVLQALHFEALGRSIAKLRLPFSCYMFFSMDTPTYDRGAVKVLMFLDKNQSIIVSEHLYNCL